MQHASDGCDACDRVIKMACACGSVCLFVWCLCRVCDYLCGRGVSRLREVQVESGFESGSKSVAREGGARPRVDRRSPAHERRARAGGGAGESGCDV